LKLSFFEKKEVKVILYQKLPLIDTQSLFLIYHIQANLEMKFGGSSFITKQKQTEGIYSQTRWRLWSRETSLLVIDYFIIWFFQFGIIKI